MYLCQRVYEKGEKMDNENNMDTKDCGKTKVVHRGHSSSAVYGIGLIGAWIYFIGTAGTFWLGVLGFLKGLVWPAFLVYAALKSLGV
jgi:hypothetical protein